MALFTDPNTLSPVQRVAATIGQSSDPYVNLGRALGLMGAVTFGGASTQTPYEQEMAFMQEFGQGADWTDPTSIKKLSSMASDYGLTDLSGKLMEESFSLSKELAKAAASAKKDRDVTAMRESDVTNITSYLKGQGYDVDTDRDMALINEIHSQSQRRNQSYDEALASILAGGKYSTAETGGIFGIGSSPYLTKPQGKKPTAPVKEVEDIYSKLKAAGQ